MRLSPLGPSKKVYLGLAALCLLAAGPSQWLVERGRRQAFGNPRRRLQMVELWPVLMGGFRGPVVAGLAYFAQQQEIEADVYATAATLEALITVQPEFEHLWIYYGWVMSYNLTAVLNNPEERYESIRRGADFLQEGIGRIAEIYEAQKPYVNDRCPMTKYPIEGPVTADTSRQFEGQTVAFFGASEAAAWDKLTETEKGIRIEAVRDATLEYKRKRATLLFMLGWTYYQKLAYGEDADKYYRAFYRRDTRKAGQEKDPFQVAYTYLARASAVDVVPYQISYHVLKTAPVHCLQDRARTFAADPRVNIKVLAEAFRMVNDEWKRSLPVIKNKQWIMHSVEQMELAGAAMKHMADAEEAASLGNGRRANAMMDLARKALETYKARQPDGAYMEIYNARYKLQRERVDKLLRGEPL